MKQILVFLIAYCVLLIAPVKAHAIYDPLTLPNNKVGIHILFPQEINDAARLVNENGDWGYVTIPIQAGDKDLEKWQKFMDDARQLHVVPIVRIATEGDYFNTKVWRAGTAADILDFANFLNSLIWPLQNRYVVIFNEVNRGDEWGGSPNPAEYADLLSYATVVFKDRNPDFFVISAGLDNAATTTETAINEYDFMRQIEANNPGVFAKIDGIASHSYPNPGFSKPPTYQTRQSIASFRFEKALADELAKKPLPVFITETGWKSDVVAQDVIKSYYNEAFSTVWNDISIVAVTPFLLRAGAGVFEAFSFVNKNATESGAYEAIKTMEKIRGNPLLAKDPRILGKETKTVILEPKQFTKANLANEPAQIPKGVKVLIKWLLML